MKKQFETTVGKLEDSRVYMYHVVVPNDVALFYKEKKQKRLLCEVNNMKAFPSAILMQKNGLGYINLNKERLKKGKLKVGDKINVTLSPDQSEYGMPMPPEIEEIFLQDDAAKKYFHELTPGKQRTLLYMIGKIKTSDKRIEKSVIMMNYLKRVKGQLDFKELNQAFKDGL